MKNQILQLAKNKYVFYVAVVLAVINVVGYVGMRAWECLVMFAAVAYATKCYAKNNTIAVLAGLFVSNFVFSCNKMKEGFEEAMDHDMLEGEDDEELEEFGIMEGATGSKKEKNDDEEEDATSMANALGGALSGAGKGGFANLM